MDVPIIWAHGALCLFMGHPLPTNESGKLRLGRARAQRRSSFTWAARGRRTRLREREGGRESEGKSERKEGSRLGRLRGSERASARAGVRASAVSKRCRGRAAAGVSAMRCEGDLRERASER